MSVGRRGAWFTFGSKGTRATVGLPGTGLSYTTSASYGSSQPSSSSQLLGCLGIIILVAFICFLISLTNDASKPQSSAHRKNEAPSTAVHHQTDLPVTVEDGSKAVKVEAHQSTTVHEQEKIIPRDTAENKSTSLQNVTPLTAPLNWKNISGNPYLWPGEISLVKSVTFPAVLNGSVIGVFDAPAGSMVKVISFDGQRLEIKFGNSTTRVFLDVTDFETRTRSLMKIRGQQP